MVAAYGHVVGERTSFENPWEVVQSLRKYIRVMERRLADADRFVEHGELENARKMLRWGAI